MLTETNTKKLDQTILAETERWIESVVKKSLQRVPERKRKFKTLSDIPIKALYNPNDIPNRDYMNDMGFPGEYPFLRGAQPTSYRARLWTMRMFAGMGTAKETNERFKYLIKNGQTGLSTAFHLPTIYGYESGSPMSAGEIGKEGVAIDTLADMEALFDGIDLGKISTSMTINAPASILLAMYIAVGEKQGVPMDKLTGTTQNDILKEYQAQKSYIYPPEPSMRLIVDTIEFCTEHVPKWNTISISGYHIREAGSTAVQELAFTLGNGLAYVEAGIARGLDVDDFAPRLSFFFNAHNNFFEEIAKYRAARRIWARHMKEIYHAKDPRSWRLRFHTQTAGVALTAQEPYNNIIRVTMQALAAVLGGTQSLHTNSFDEALALPSEEAVKIALRTQQIIAHETGVADTIDPLGGSYFVEWLTDKMEEEAEAYFAKVKGFGKGSMLEGAYVGIRNNFYQREIANASYQYQKEIESKEQIQVCVNAFQVENVSNKKPDLLKIGEEVGKQQIESLAKVKSTRDSVKAQACLDMIREKAQTKENLMPYILDAVKAYCSIGEIVDVFRDEFGVYREESIF
ncbi:MAG: acyl-CoA mutase large subunit family protein [Promethearchaeota archaeon]